MYLPEATIKTHVAYIYRKLGLRDRAQAVVYAHKASRPEHQPTTSTETPSSSGRTDGPKHRDAV